jgi:hypothetical protein
MSRDFLVWNRAALEKGGTSPKEGDRALAAMILAHSRAMNGGLLHAAVSLKAEPFRAATEGYRFFGLEAAARLLEEAREFRPEGPDAEEEWELEVDRRYGEIVENDSALFARFEEHFARHPELYAPA